MDGLTGNQPADAEPTLTSGAPAMHDHRLGDALSSIAAQAVPDTTDLWPAINSRLATRGLPARLRVDRRGVGFAAAMAIAIVVVFVLVQPSLPGQSGSAQAADIARNDPEVAAILRGDIAIVTVTSVVDQVATVAVVDSHGNQVTVSVDLRSRIATVVYQGPQLSTALMAQALAIVRADPRTRALLARGATIGRVTPIAVTFELASPTAGAPTTGSATWAQVPLDLGGQEWLAYVDLTLGRIDHLADPQGNDVPLP
jgi:hypothetical protein